MTQNFNNLYSGLESRDYQIKAREDMTAFTKKWLKNELTNDKNIDLWSSMPVLMATGSGKTATVGKHLHKIFITRDRLERYKKEEYPLRILVLNDRINLVNQIKEDFIHGRDGKPPLLGEDIESHATIKLYHSKADSTENTIVEDGVDIEGFGKDEIYFSTFLSAKKFDNEKLGRDIIIIDEAHHLSGSTYRNKLNRNISKSIKYKGHNPLIIPMSATMDKVRHLFNEPVVDFGLADYIASEYSPEIKYNLVTSSDFSNKDLEDIKEWIDEVSNITDFKEKKEQIAEIKEYIELHLAKFGGMTELCKDVLQRLDSIDHTIIFVNSIEEADEITDEINRLTGDNNTAIALHSRIDEASSEVLNNYRSGKNKIIIAINMLNEGMDIPQTNNVVFWRSTKSSDLFQQQFGRGLRGNLVNFYDYTGVLANMAYINGINQEIIDKREYGGGGGGNGGIKKGIDMLFGDIRGKNNIEHIVTLEDVIKKVRDLENDIDLPQIGDNRQVEINGELYQQVSHHTTPEDQLWGLQGPTIHYNLKKQSQEWKDQFMKNAKSKSGKIVEVYEINALKKLLENKIDIPQLGDNGQIEIDGSIYQQIGVLTPSEQLWEISGTVVQNKIENQSQDWKDQFMKNAKSKKSGAIIQVCEINQLKILLENDIGIPQLGDNGQVLIDEEIYQRVGANTPSEQLWGLTPHIIKSKIDKQSQDWKDQFMKKAKVKNGTVDVCEINQLKILLENDIGIPQLGDNGQIEIDGSIYQRTGDGTSSYKFLGISGKTIKRKIENQSQDWKDQFMKKARVKNGTVDVCEINTLKELLKDEIGLIQLGNNGQVEIDEAIYQRVGHKTPSEQLWGLTPSIVKNRISKQSQDWKDKFMKRAKVKNGTVDVCEINALKELLGIKDDKQDTHKKLKDF